MAAACRALPYENVTAQGNATPAWCIAFRCIVASSSDCPPDRKAPDADNSTREEARSDWQVRQEAAEGEEGSTVDGESTSTETATKDKEEGSKQGNDS